jgi:hypothetical protein
MNSAGSSSKIAQSLSLTTVCGRSWPLAVSVCHLPFSSSYSMVSVWPGISCSSAAACAAASSMGQESFREHAIDLIRPTAVVLDNLIGDIRHETPFGFESTFLYHAQKSATITTMTDGVVTQMRSPQALGLSGHARGPSRACESISHLVESCAAGRAQPHRRSMSALGQKRT